MTDSFDLEYAYAEVRLRLAVEHLLAQEPELLKRYGTDRETVLEDSRAAVALADRLMEVNPGLFREMVETSRKVIGSGRQPQDLRLDKVMDKVAREAARMGFAANAAQFLERSFSVDTEELAMTVEQAREMVRSEQAGQDTTIYDQLVLIERHLRDVAPANTDISGGPEPDDRGPGRKGNRGERSR